MMNDEHLLFYSGFPFSPAIAAVLEELVTRYGMRLTVIAPPAAGTDEVRMHAPAGYEPDRLRALPGADVRLVPLTNRENPWHGFDPNELGNAFSGLLPNAVWIYPEPVCGPTRQLLRRFFSRRRTKIFCVVQENRFTRPPLVQRIKASILCSRIDALLASATVAGESLKRSYWLPGMRAYTLFLPNLDPGSISHSRTIVPRQGTEFWIGFAGRICREKGWDHLLEAVTRLPPEVKVAFAGDGPDAGNLQNKIEENGLRARALLCGSLAAGDLAAFYHQIDALAVPSLTTDRWMEQFGRVIAEAMGAAVPVVGYDSGSIPEVVGNAGLIIREGDMSGLASSLLTLLTDPQLRLRLGKAGRARFEQLFSPAAYARRFHELLLMPRLP